MVEQQLKESLIRGFESNKAEIIEVYKTQVSAAPDDQIEDLLRGEYKTNDHLKKMIEMIGLYASLGPVMEQYNQAVENKSVIQVIDMFSGCGGVSVGFKILNQLVPVYDLIASVDINVHANKSYEANIGMVPFELDINKLANEDEVYNQFLDSIKRDTSKPLVLIGCAPCQGFSSHRKKHKGVEDTRNSLVEDFAKVAVKMQPDIVFMENVPDLLSKKHWSHFQAFKRVMESNGYNVKAAIHNLAEFGVPQERFRAVVVASKGSFSLPSGLLARDRFITVRDAIGYLPPLVPGFPDANDPSHVTTKHRQSTVDTIAQVPKDGGKRPFGIGPQCLDKVNGFSDVYGRLYWDKPAITITAFSRNPASGRYSHPEQNRGLSIREAAILQGFPKNYFFEGPFDGKFLQIGNAVPPRFSTYISAYFIGTLLGVYQDDEQLSFDLEVTKPVSNSYSSVISGLKTQKRA